MESKSMSDKIMKAYTDLEQSKKLAEILPIESADMCLTFVNNVWNPVWGKVNDIYQLQKNCYEPGYTKNNHVDIDEFEPKVIPCWSLAALLSLMPNFNMFKRTIECRIETINHLIDKACDPIDAAFEMVVWLKENRNI